MEHITVYVLCSSSNESLQCQFLYYREKKLLVGSDDFGRDLTGVQNLRKKHKRLEAELNSHEPAIQVCKSII